MAKQSCALLLILKLHLQDFRLGAQWGNSKHLILNINHLLSIFRCESLTKKLNQLVFIVILSVPEVSAGLKENSTLLTS